MTPDAAVTSSLPRYARDTGFALGVGALVALGYLGVPSLQISGALLAVLTLAGCAALAFHRPRLALATAFPILLLAGTKFRMRDPLASLDGLLDAQILLELALFAVVAAGLAGVCLRTQQRWHLSKAEGAVAAYAALAALSTLWSDAPALTLVRSTQLLILAGLAIVVVRVLGGTAGVWTAGRSIAAYVVVCAMAAAVIPGAAGTLEQAEGVRFSWFAMHPISAGTLAGGAALTMLSLAVFRRSRGAPAANGFLVSGAILALTTVLILTSARGPLLAFVAGAGVLCLLRLRPAIRIPLAIMATTLVLSAMYFGAELRSALDAWAAQDSATARSFFRGQTADTVLSLNGRVGLWDDLRPSIVERLTGGHGYQASRGVLLDAAAWAGYAHNAALQTLLDLGVIGALALGAVVVAGAGAAIRDAGTAWLRATVAALLVFLVVNSISTESFAGAPGVETLLIFICALAGAARPLAGGAPQGIA